MFEIRKCSNCINVCVDPVPESAADLVKQAVNNKWAIYSLASGLESLPQAMYTALLDRGVKVHLNQPCTALHFSGSSAQVCVCVCVSFPAYMSCVCR